MKKQILLSILLLTLSLINSSAHADVWYVAPTGANGNGKSWSTPFVGVGNIAWTGIKAGDVVCIGGGTYGGFAIGASGASGNPLTFKRAVSGDAQCGTSVAGWTSALDATVNFSNIGVSGRSYITVDGQKPGGIKISYGECGNGVTLMDGQSFTLVNTEIVGAGVLYNYRTGPTGCSGTTVGVYVPATKTYNGITIRKVWNHDTTNAFWISHSTGFTIENSELYNIGAGNEDDGTNNGPHSNLAYLEYVNDLTFRYNNAYNYRSTGLYPSLDGTQSTGWKIYGNVFHNAAAFVVSTGRGAIQVEMYNNTVYNVGDLDGNILNMVHKLAGCKFYNNIFWNTGAVSYNGSAVGNNFYQSSLWWVSAGEPGVVISATDPVANGAARDFTLKSGSKAIDVGAAIAPVAGHTYNLDKLGEARPKGAAWDIGAYEYGVASTTPSAPTGLRVQ